MAKSIGAPAANRRAPLRRPAQRVVFQPGRGAPAANREASLPHSSGFGRTGRVLLSSAVLAGDQEDAGALRHGMRQAEQTGKTRGRTMRPCPDRPARAPGLPGAGGWGGVAVQDLGPVRVPGGGGAVGVQDDGPAHLVDHDVVVVPAKTRASGQAGLAAAGPGGQVVDLAPGGGLVAAAQLVAVHQATYFPNPHRKGSRDQARHYSQAVTHPRPLPGRPGCSLRWLALPRPGGRCGLRPSGRGQPVTGGTGPSYPGLRTRRRPRSTCRRASSSSCLLRSLRKPPNDWLGRSSTACSGRGAGRSCRHERGGIE